VSSTLASLMRLASIVICLIAIASFTLFVVNQSSNASAHQQNEVKSGSAAPASSLKKSSVRKSIDSASNTFTSPFSGITAGWSSQWAIRGVDLLLVLVIYGFGLSFLARTIRGRL
jgi:hypothetical protein